MGYQLAQAACRRGARALLISGPTKLDPPSGVKFIAVRSTEQMREQVLKHLSEASIVIKAAAVSDFRPKTLADQKIKKDGQSLVLELEPNPDILKEVAAKKEGRILVGFAAETESVLQNGEKKLKESRRFWSLTTSVKQTRFDSDTNIVTILTCDGHQPQLTNGPKPRSQTKFKSDSGLPKTSA
jgi:phosphopantothenoylcysteine decarboxylase/phosphopantothenate--cysteine ligase